MKQMEQYADSGRTLLIQVRLRTKWWLEQTTPSRTLAIQTDLSMAAPATLVQESPKKCAKIGIWHEHGMSNSCCLHDLQSAFRLAMQQFVGEGGLDARSALQLLHTLFSLYLVLKSRWKRVISLVWKQINTQEQILVDLLISADAPKDLVKAMQEPLVTRWWTIGSLAILTTKQLAFFLLLAKGVCNMRNMDQ
jgi:hypothetical protein